jgi:hypothetical protein
MPPLFQRQEELAPGLMQRVGNAATAARYALFGYPGVGQVERALNPDPQVTNRASMLPIGNYDDGSVGLAWPQSLIDAKEAFGRFHRGEAPQPQDAVLAGLAMTGGMFVPKPSNTVGMFGGRLARTADHAKLAQAEEMAARGASRDDIWSQTGWFKGPDDKWRFEIDDSGSSTRNSFMHSAQTGTADALEGATASVSMGVPTTTLQGAFNHPSLYDAYPDLAATGFTGEYARRVLRKDGSGRKYMTEPPPNQPVHGGFWGDDNSIVVGAPDAQGFRSGVLHEAQHAIQQREGFAPGGSPREGSSFGQLGEITPDGFDAYRRRIGEVEARNVQRRMDMTPAERRLTPPWRTQDVSDENQIFSNPKEAAPAGLLATSNLDRMKAAESAPARSIPDAPQSIPELQGMIDSNLDRFAVSRSVGDQAFSQDPARYNAYAYGLHDVMNPDSEWAMSSPTVHSGGLVPFGTSAPGLMQPPAQPDGPGLMAQQSPSERLQERGYLDNVPPSSVMQEALSGQQQSAYEAFMRPRIDALEGIGIPPLEARALITEMPDVESYRKRLSDEALSDPRVLETIRKLLEDSH